MITKITRMSVDNLTPAPYNPRTIDDAEMEKLKASIKKYGVVENLVWNKRSGHVVGGNQRLKAIISLGIKEVPVIVVDLTEKAEKTLNMALNRISGDWDVPQLKVVLESLGSDFQTLAGFDTDELDGLLRSVKTADDLIPDTPDPTLRPLGGGEAHTDNNSSIAPPSPQRGKPFVVYLSFGTKEKADAWLLENFDDKIGIKAGKKTKVIIMED